MSKQTSSKCKGMSGDLQATIYKLYQFFSLESKVGHLLADIHKVIPRLSLALKIPQGTIRSVILKAENKCVSDVVESMHTGNLEKKVETRGRRRKLDNFDECTIRHTVHAMYRSGQFISMSVLLKKLQIKGLHMSASTLYRTLKRMGFKYYKNGTGKKFVGERPDVIAHRHTYLRDVKRFRDDGLDVVYTDETWLNANHACKGEWNEGKMGDLSAHMPGCSDCGRYIPTGKGKRLIVVDAGSAKHGFISGAGLVFLSKTKSGDYHDEMNAQHYLDWFENQLLIGLPEPSVIVLDNATYHNTLTEDTKCPTRKDTKDVIQSWLKSRNIPFNNSFIKEELLQVIKRNKPPAMYATDRLAMMYGHQVMRLPVKHCELNPIELIQAELKCGVARRNTTFKMKDVKNLFTEVKETVGVESWKKAVQHVIGIEDCFWKTDGVREHAVEPVAFDVCDSDGTESSVSGSSGTNSFSETSSESNISINDESDAFCIVCKADFPPQLPQNSTEIVKWAQCDFCEGWVHLKFCCKLTSVDKNSVFSCHQCSCKLKNIEPEP